MAKAYSYVRFSRIEQKKGDSLRRQREGIIALAARFKLDIDDSLEYTDEAISSYRGQHAESGQLAAFLEATKKGIVKPGDHLFIENLDRLSRQEPMESVKLLGAICEMGVIVVTTTDGQVYSKESLNSNSLLMAVMSFMLSHAESKKKAERLKQVWAQKRKTLSDKPLTKQTPAWVQIVDGRLVLREDRAVVVRRIFELYCEGIGQHSIADILNAEGVKPWGPLRKTDAPGAAKPWHTSYIVKILDNPATIGEFVPHTLEFTGSKKRREPLPAIKDYFPPVIDKEIFIKVRELRGGNKAKGRKGKQPLLNLFSGVLYCKHCGMVMTRVTKNSAKGWVYLCCVAAKAGATVEDTNFRFCSGGYGAIKYSFVEDALIDAVLSKQFVVNCNEEKINDLQKKIKEHKEREDEFRKDSNNLIDSIIDGSLKGKTPYHHWTIAEEIEFKNYTADEIRKTITDLNFKIDTMRPAIIDKKLKELHLALLIKPLNREKANAALRVLCEKMIIDDNGLNITFKHSEQGLTIPLPRGKA